MGLTIRQKLNFLTFMAIASAILLIFTIAYVSYKDINRLNKVKELVLLSTKLSLLVHETQKERGASAGYLGSKGKKFKTILPNQRAKTDKRIKELNEFLNKINFNDYPDVLKKDVHDILNKLNMLQDIRNRVSSLNISAKEAINYYTGLNKDILDVIPLAARLAKNEKIAKDLIAYSNFLQAKERAGIERAVLTATFANKGFKNGMKSKEIQLIAEQNSYLNTFLSIANEEMKNYYKKISNSETFKTVQNLRNKALKSDFSVDSENWFKTITEKINGLKQIDDFIASLTISAIDEQIKTTKRNAFLYIVILAIAAVVMVIIVVTISRNINKNVNLLIT